MALASATAEKPSGIAAGRASNGLTAQDKEKHRRLDATLDKLRARYGRRVVYYGSVQESRDDAPMRISFAHIPDLKIEQD